MSDDRMFFKLHNGFPEHPKTIELSDKAFRQLVETWCYCSRNLNDGKLTNAQVSKFFSPKSRRELIATGFLVEVENSWEMHDYLEHQMSAQQVADLRKHRAEAGSKGGKAKAKGVASATGFAKQNASKPLPDIDVDVDTPTYVGVVKSPQVTNTPRNNPGQSGTRIPTNFTATPEMIRWALDNAPNVNHKASTQKFKAHYRSVSGPAQFKTDWAAAWESWLLSDQQRADEKPKQFKTGAEKRLEQGRAQHELFAQMDAERANAAKEITQ